jgi:hypothetical protein
MRQCIDPWGSADTERRSTKNQCTKCIVARCETTVDVGLKDADWQGGGGEVDTPILTD